MLDGPNGQETVVVRGSLSGDDYTFVREVRELRRPKDPAKG